MRPVVHAVLLAAAFGLTACQGGVMVFSTPEGAGGGGGPDGPRETFDNNITTPDEGCVGIECEIATASPTPNLTRLTHIQWENAARDVLLLEERSGLSGTFQEDTLPPGLFNRDSRNLEITNLLWDDYREAAETLAGQVTADAGALARIVPDGAASEPRAQAEAVVRAVGKRAYRRALTEDEVTKHMELYDLGGNLADSESPHLVGLRLAISAMLQSPFFLNRVELTQATATAPERLSGLEIASRLSFALWDTGPDDALLARAEAGDLDTREGVAAVAREMLGDDRARETMLGFYEQLIQLSKYEGLERRQPGGPEFNAQVGRAMREEVERFLLDVLVDEPRGLRALLTSTTGFVNADVAPFYELEGEFTQEFTRVDLGARRPGFLTRTGPMAYMSGEEQPAPIKRGHFMLVHLTCTEVPDAPEVLNGDPFEGNTNRERWEAMTGECGAICHSAYLNPAGFAFENYGPTGQWRELDGDQVVDAKGRFSQGSPNEDVIEFTDAADAMRQLAESPRAHACHARHWFEYVSGRPPGEAEAPLLAQIARASLDDDISVVDAIVAIVTSDTFITRLAPSD